MQHSYQVCVFVPDRVAVFFSLGLACSDAGLSRMIILEVSHHYLEKTIDAGDSVPLPSPLTKRSHCPPLLALATSMEIFPLSYSIARTGRCDFRDSPPSPHIQITLRAL